MPISFENMVALFVMSKLDIIQSCKSVNGLFSENRGTTPVYGRITKKCSAMQEDSYENREKGSAVGGPSESKSLDLNYRSGNMRLKCLLFQLWRTGGLKANLVTR